MKIMHVLKHSVRGAGNVHVAVDLACEQADLGHEVTFVSARGSYDDLLAEHRVEAIEIPESGGVRGIANSAAALLAVARRVCPEVIHAHMMSSAILGFGVSKLVGAPLVTTVHNSFDGHSRLMRLGKVVVAVSEAERRLLIARGFRPGRLRTVLNGPDGSAREALDGEDLGPLQRPSVIVLSGLHRRKAVSDVIIAFAAVATEHPEWHLNIVGWGADRERLEGMVADRGLEHSVHFLGSTLTPRPLLAQSDVFATATLADPCPLTVGEARAAGCAIAATAVGGIPELLDHGTAGLLSPPADPGALADSFRMLMADPPALSRWQARAKDGAEYLTVRRMTEDYLDVYAAAGAGAGARTSRTRS